MTDPLVDLLDEMGRAHEEYWDDQYLNYQLPFNEHEAKWLREHRDRVIRLLYADDRDAALLALGGRHSGGVWTNTAIGASTNRGWRRTDRWEFVKQPTAPSGEET